MLLIWSFPASPQIRMRDDALPLAHIAIAVEGASAASPDIVPLMVANSIIGSYDLTYGGGKHLSSRLARLAEEKKLCHSFQAFHSSYSDTGLLGIHFVADKHNIEDMMHWSQNAWSVMTPGQRHTQNTITILWSFLVIGHSKFCLISPTLCSLQDEPVHHSDRK